MRAAHTRGGSSGSGAGAGAEHRDGADLREGLEALNELGLMRRTRHGSFSLIRAFWSTWSAAMRPRSCADLVASQDDGSAAVGASAWSAVMPPCLRRRRCRLREHERAQRVSNFTISDTGVCRACAPAAGRPSKVHGGHADLGEARDVGPADLRTQPQPLLPRGRDLAGDRQESLSDVRVRSRSAPRTGHRPRSWRPASSPRTHSRASSALRWGEAVVIIEAHLGITLLAMPPDAHDRLGFSNEATDRHDGVAVGGDALDDRRPSRGSR